MKSILLVEDDLDTNKGLSAYLKAKGYTVYAAYEGFKAIELVRSKDLDLMLLDVMLPTISGLEVLAEIRKFSLLPVLVVTALNDKETELQAFDGLADGFITKPIIMDELIRRIKAVEKKIQVQEARQQVSKWCYKAIVVDFAAFETTVAGQKIDLTPKEILLLKYFVQHKNRVLTREEIINSVWGMAAFSLESRVVDTYISTIRKKTQLDCITTIKGVGYKMEG